MRIIGVTMLVLSAIGFGILFIVSHPSQAQKKVMESQTEIHCRNAEFQADVLFITKPEQALEFFCVVEPEQVLSKGYVPEPATYEWKVSSGEVESEKHKARWSKAEAGLQTIRVSGSLLYRSTEESSGLFAAEPPDIEIPFETEMKALYPHETGIKWEVVIDGFPIGKYPDPTNPQNLEKSATPNRIVENKSTYMPPRYYYEVTPETFFLRIHKNYWLGNFDLDPRFMDLEYPRYIAIEPRIIRKLDDLQELMNSEGVEVSKFNIIYAYRSPDYNLGSRAEDDEKTLKSPFSAHMYGQAIDFIVDEDDDFVIDDLNQDGEINIEDARVMQDFATKLDTQYLEQGKQDMVGGAFIYYHHDYWERGEYAQTPYLHMDVRGYTREDGSLIRSTIPDTIGITQEANPYRLKKPIPPWPFSKPKH